MNKEFESLERFVRTSVWNDDEFHEIWDNGNSDLELLKNALHRLEQIDNAKPSEAMKSLEENTKLFDEIALENPTTYKNETFAEAFIFKLNVDKIQQSLLKSQEQDELLKIIENKLFSIIYFVDEIRPEIHKTNYSDYKYWYTRKRFGKSDEMYTEDEFNKIMNWLYKKRGKNNES